jgi:hypothetical protein
MSNILKKFEGFLGLSVQPQGSNLIKEKFLN